MNNLNRTLSPSAICVFLIAFLAVFLKFWEPGIGFSSSSYGALAKSMTEFGWFHPRLGPQLFDPFVDHPYFVLWLDALVFKVFGASTQTIRLVSSIAGVSLFVALFYFVQGQWGPRQAVFACISLFLVNEFMHFASSGWLDLPMIAWVWGGLYLLANVSPKSAAYDFFGGSFLGLAVLSKGLSALAVVPILLWAVFSRRTGVRRTILVFVGLGLPILIFTVLHYQSEHFLFWSRYLVRQVFVQNEVGHQLDHAKNLLWYVGDILRYGHIVTVLGILGLWEMLKSNSRPWAILILGELAIHIVAYSFSSRHYGQYVIPVFPWLAVAAGFYLAQRFPKVDTERLIRGGLVFAVVGFVALDLLPVKVHSGMDHPFRSFQTAMTQLKDNHHVYFYGKLEDQTTWEDMASDIPWYWQREPLIADVETILAKVDRDDPAALGVMPYEVFQSQVAVRLAQLPRVKLCLWNQTYAILANRDVCKDEDQSFRPLPTEF